MATTLEKIKEQLLANLLSIVVFPSLLLLVGTVWTLTPLLIDPLWKRVPVPTLQRLWTLSFLSIVALLAYVLFLRRKQAKKLRLQFGIYWDRDGNCFCPACRTPLTGYTVDMTTGPVVACVKCDKVIAIRNHDGEHLLLRNAQKFIIESFSHLQLDRSPQ